MILLDGSHLTVTDLLAIADSRAAVGVAPEARTRVAASRAVVDHKADGADAVYGVNTDFGSFAETRIDKRDLAALQLNLLRSHAAGVGSPLPVRVVRAAMALRANVLAKGYSGVRLETLEALVALLNAGVHPRVPSRGSVGASGDLAPLAHLALVLVGEGEVLQETTDPDAAGQLKGREALRAIAGIVENARHPHRSTPGADALSRAGLKPVALAPKEGLALINGTQASTAVLALAVLAVERLTRAADVAAAMTVDALR